MVWDSIMFVTTVFALIFDPLSIAFTADEQSPTSFFVVSDRIVMSIFFCDIILNFLTGYVDKKDQRIIMHWRDVATNYIKFWCVTLTLDLCLTPIVTVTLPDHPAEILNDAKLTAGS